MRSTVELKRLELPVELGTYAPGDVVPDAHFLDLTLTINTSRVLIESDEMAAVFDYDPLIREIDRIARDGHYETQEWLITRISRACSQHREIEEVDVMVYKTPVLAGSGKLGVRLTLDRSEMERLRSRAPEK